MPKRKDRFTDHYVRTGKLDQARVWLANNLVLETIMGSRAFATDKPDSDFDVLAIVMPKREHLYPQLYGKVLGVDKFDFFHRLSLKGPMERIKVGEKEVEIEFVSLVSFIKLVGFEGSPLVEVLFTRPNMVTFGTKIGFTLRDNRHLFISLKNVDAIKGFATSQMRRIRSKRPVSEERRQIIEKYGYDIKMASHVIRTLNEARQILEKGDMDLTENREEHKYIKSGEWGNLEHFESVYHQRLAQVEELRTKTKIPPECQEDKIRALLRDFIEEQYGSLSQARKESEYVSAAEVMAGIQAIRGDIKALNSSQH